MIVQSVEQPEDDSDESEDDSDQPDDSDWPDDSDPPEDDSDLDRAGYDGQDIDFDDPLENIEDFLPDTPQEIDEDVLPNTFSKWLDYNGKKILKTSFVATLSTVYSKKLTV